MPPPEGGPFPWREPTLEFKYDFADNAYSSATPKQTARDGFFEIAIPEHANPV